LNKSGFSSKLRAFDFRITKRTAVRWITSDKASLTPALALLVLMLFYIVFDNVFVKCVRNLVGCRPVPSVVEALFPHTELSPIKPATSLSDSELREVEANRKLLADRYSRRLLWMFVAAAGVLAGIAAMVTAGILLYRSYSTYPNPGQPTVGWLLLAVAAGVVFWMRPDWHMSIMKDVLEKTIALGTDGVPSIVSVMNLLNVINYVGGLALVFATCAILLPRSGGKWAAAGYSSLDVIAEQMRDVRAVLYVGTVQLVTGVIRMSAVSLWTLAYVAPGAWPAVKSFDAVVVFITGGFYTLVLIAIYLPAALILAARARAEVSKLPAVSSYQRDRMLRQKGLSMSFKNMVPRLIALLAPLLAGPLGELLKAYVSQ